MERLKLNANTENESFERRKPTEITILKKKKKAQEFNKLLYVYMTHIYIQICIEH